MQYSDNASEVIADCGEELYQQKIRDKVEATHKGKFLAIDVKTGDYAVADEDLAPQTFFLRSVPMLLSTVYELAFQPPTELALRFRFQHNDYRNNYRESRSYY